MPCVNTSSSEAEQTFKNKHIKEVLKHFKQFALVTSSNVKWTHPGSAMSVFKIPLWIFAIFGFIFPAHGGDEKGVMINRPIVKDTSDRQPWASFSSEYIRCFCNLPQCVSTGYMCKSNGEGCFSDLLDQSYNQQASTYRGRHGCVELLTNIENNWCNNSNGGRRRKPHPRALLHCCFHDMCNHADSPEAASVFNNTLLDNIQPENDNKLIETVVNQDSNGYANPDVWFKAATIAVPICGAVILFALIALAIRILRTESMNSRNCKLGSALYLNSSRSPNKHTCDGVHRHYDRNYENVLCDQMLMSRNNPNLYSNHNDDLQRHTLAPLLVQNNPNGDVYLLKEINQNLNLYNNHDGIKCGESVVDRVGEVCSKYNSDSNICNDVNINRDSFNSAHEGAHVFSKEKICEKDCL